MTIKKLDDVLRLGKFEPTFASELAARYEIAQLPDDPAGTEFLANHIFQEMALKVRGGELGLHASGLTKLRVTLNESHVARAWCEADLA